MHEYAAPLSKIAITFSLPFDPAKMRENHNDILASIYAFTNATADWSSVYHP